jgi:hypothetical protein
MPIERTSRSYCQRPLPRELECMPPLELVKRIPRERHGSAVEQWGRFGRGGTIWKLENLRVCAEMAGSRRQTAIFRPCSCTQRAKSEGNVYGRL